MCLRTLGGTLRKHEVTLAFRKGSSGVDPLRAELTRARRWHVGQKKQEREKRPERAGSPPTRQNAGADAGFPGLPAAGRLRSDREPGGCARARSRARAFPGRAARLARGLGGGVARPGGGVSGAWPRARASRREGVAQREAAPRRREGRPSPGSGAPRWDWFLRSHFLSNQTADWRREPTRAALEVCVSLRPMIAPKPTPL